jgi:segregation and condensation protein B
MDEPDNIIAENTAAGNYAEGDNRPSGEQGVAAIVSSGNPPVAGHDGAGNDNKDAGGAEPKISRGALNREDIKPIIESLLFINEKPIEPKEIVGILDIDRKEIELALDELVEQYRGRRSGVCIVKVAGGYQMCSAPESAPWVKKMYQERNKQKLSLPALETLAIVAYKQPVTRMEIEAIRGVNVDNMVRNLTELGLVKTEGRKEVIGRPFLYITTRKFLEYFGLNSLKDLPKLEEFSAIVAKDGLAGGDGAASAPAASDIVKEEAAGKVNIVAAGNEHDGDCDDEDDADDEGEDDADDSGED